MKNEEFYFYFISLKTDFIKFADYESWLNGMFLNNNANDFLLELQFCTNDIEKTIYNLNIYLYNKLASLDYHEVGKMIMSELRKQYNKNLDSMQTVTPKLYKIWNLLPPEISNQEPFINFVSIDDYWDILGREKILKSLQKLFNYYNDKP